MRRRRRAASGPLGGMGGSFILDVILHLDSRHVKNKSWVYGSAMGVQVGGMSLGQDQTVEGSTDHDTGLCAGIRTEPETLLTNF